jgi:hypothetical protein
MVDAENPGLELVGPGLNISRDTPRTLVVLGVSRGGTSATTGILAQLGVYMGNSGEAPMYEDLYLNRAVRNGAEDDFRQRIASYNSAHTVWGYKGVVLNRNLAQYHRLFRNPLYLVVYRDLLAIASRARISGGHDIQKVMARQINEYSRILRFISEQQPNALLLSYEKLRLDPAPLVEKIALFVGLNADLETLSRAVDSVRQRPSDYPASRTN